MCKTCAVGASAHNARSNRQRLWSLAASYPSQQLFAPALRQVQLRLWPPSWHRDLLQKDDEYRCPAGQRLINRCKTIENGMTLSVYWSSQCAACPMKAQCTPGKERRVRRWKHEAVIDAMQARLDREPEKMRLRRQTAEHPFGTIKAWMGATHFLTKTLGRVSTEMRLHVLAYNLKRVMKILGIRALIEAIRRLRDLFGSPAGAICSLPDVVCLLSVEKGCLTRHKARAQYHPTEQC